MADLKRIINQVINVDTGYRLISTTDATRDPVTQELDRATQVLFRTTLVKSNSTPYQPDSNATYLFGIGKDLTGAVASRVITTNNVDFNKAEDWPDPVGLAPTGGRICWRTDLTEDALKQAMKDLTADPSWYACLWMLPPLEKPVLISQWPALIHRIAVDPTTAVASPGIVHATTDWAKASFIPVWGDGAAIRYKKPYLQEYFSDGKWRSRMTMLVDGQPTRVWGDPED